MSQFTNHRTLRQASSLVISRFLSSILPALFLIACSSDVMTNGDPIPPDLQLIEDMAPPQDTSRLILLRSVRWPGGGREMTVGILNQATGLAFQQDLSSRLLVQPPDGIAVTTKVQKIALAPGYTAVLLPPSLTAPERASLSTAILNFAAKRPASERIALYRHGATVQLYSNYLQDRTKLTEALDRYQKGIDGDPNPLPLLQAVGPAASEVRDVGGSGSDVMRSLVVLAKDTQSVYLNYSQIYMIAVSPDDAGLTMAANGIDDARQNAFYKLSACSSEAKFSAILKVANMQGDLSASFPATLPEETGVACNVDAIDTKKRTYTPRIEFVFDAAQRAAHDARLRATQAATFDEPLARSDFDLQVRLAPGQPTVLAQAHLHGNGSLRCDRHSYSLQLSGSARYLMPDSATDEFTLISMCDDLAYVYAPTVYGLLSDDLFPLKFRFIELIIDGQTRGIYQIIEKTSDELISDNARVSSIMRRQYPMGTQEFFEVVYADTPDLLAPRNRFAAFAAQIAPLSGDALVSALRNQMDLDQYLRYLANQSIFKSGDYIDEVYFIGTEQANGLGGITETYRVMAWDPEGYTNCHGGGAAAYPDPNGIAYCAEGRLDHKILADPKVYAIFIKKLEDALNSTLSREKMAAGLTQTKTNLQSLLVTPAICAAMTELLKLNAGAADCAVARNLIGSRADAILAAYDARRTALTTLLATYHTKF